MWGAVDVNRKGVVGDDVVAGARVVDVGHEAVDMGCEVVDDDNALAGDATSPSMSSVTSSPSAATSIPFVYCPLTSALPFEFPSFLASLVWFGWTKTLPRRSLKGVYALIIDSEQPLPLAVGAARTGEALECLFCVLGRR